MHKRIRPFSHWIFFYFLIKVSISVEMPPSVYIPSLDTCIQGTYMYSYDKVKLNAFLGVPYAMPPIGDLRFRDPVKWQVDHPEKWNVNCKTEVDPCVHSNFREYGLTYGSEDCLFLNIFTLGNYTRKSMKPVLIELADIDFERGDASTQFYGPEFICSKDDVVLVTVNSRLGIFGYLAHTFNDGVKIHGNMGLKDQQMAIQWVHDNIKYFGGDPNRITLAGGASVSYHLVNERSTRMFKNAIIRHSNFLALYNSPWDHNSRLHQTNLDFWKYKLDKLWKTFQDLQSMEDLEIFSSLHSSNWTRCLSYPYYRFKPIIDVGNGATNPFLTSSPITIWVQNKYNFNGDIWFWGVNSSSFDWLVPMFRFGLDPLGRCNEIDEENHRPRWHKIEGLYFAGDAKNPDLNLKIHQYYFKNRANEITEKNIKYLEIDYGRHVKNNPFPIEQLFTWGQFIYPMLKLIELRPFNTQYGQNYIMLYDGQSSLYRCFRTTFYGKHLCNDAVPTIGSKHWTVRGDELIFIYLMPWYFQTPSNRWDTFFSEMHARLGYYLHHGFSNNPLNPYVPKHCYIPRLPSQRTCTDACKYQYFIVQHKKFGIVDRVFAEPHETFQFQMWDEYYERYFQAATKDTSFDTKQTFSAVCSNDK